MDRYLDRLVYMLMGDSCAARAFQVELLKRLALSQPDPKGFVRDFVSGMHARIEYSDVNMSQPSTVPQVHEHAREAADQFGANVIMALKSSR